MSFSDMIKNAASNLKSKGSVQVSAPKAEESKGPGGANPPF